GVEAAVFDDLAAADQVEKLLGGGWRRHLLTLWRRAEPRAANDSTLLPYQTIGRGGWGEGQFRARRLGRGPGASREPPYSESVTTRPPPCKGAPGIFPQLLSASQPGGRARARFIPSPETRPRAAAAALAAAA